MTNPDLQLDIRDEMDRVVALRERVEELVDADWLTGVVALPEIASLEHLGDVVFRRQMHPAGAPEGFEPFAVEADLGLCGIEKLEDLCLVRLGVPIDFRLSQRRTRLRAAGRISNQRRECPDDVDDPVPEILEVLHLPDKDRMAEMQIW